MREKNVKAQKERNKTRRVEDSRFTTRVSVDLSSYRRVIFVLGTNGCG